jgi:hypothetical protein
VTSLKNAEAGPVGGPSPPPAPAHRGAIATLLRSPWTYVTIGIVVFSYALLRWARTSPGFDPYGWLVWGYQTVRLNLDLGGAPSWKPVTWLFNVPYAAFGHLSFWLWQVTAVSFAIGGAVVAGRIVYTLVIRSTGERAPAAIGAVFSGLSLLGIVQYTHYWLSSQSDPMLVTCVLLGIDLILHRHYRWAFAFLWLASLGRPETWPFIGLYAIWCWRVQPSMRRFVTAGILLIGVGWFVVPVFSGQSPFVAYQLAQESPRELHHNKIIGTFDRFLALTYWPVKLAALIGLLLAAWRRDRAVLVIAACSALWLLVEIFFALRGLPGVPRYMFEAGAAMVVVGGVGVGWLLSAPRAFRLPERWALAGRLIGAATVIGIVAALLPGARTQERIEHKDILAQRARTTAIARLDATITHAGGAAFVRSCGDPTVDVEWVSILAWYTHMNVGKVGHRPEFAITKQNKPLVLFTALPNGWVMHTFHQTAAQRQRCAVLNNTYWVVQPGHPGGVLIHQ